MRAIGIVHFSIMGLAGLLMAPKCGDQVVVPNSDTTPPTLGARIDTNGQSFTTGNPSQPLWVTTHDPQQIFDAWVASVDAGGTRKVSFFHEVTAKCLKGSTAKLKRASFLPVSETQAGSVGQTVSSGIYVGQRFTPEEIMGNAPCDPGFALDWITYAFWVSGEDMHGNQTNWDVIGRISYTP